MKIIITINVSAKKCIKSVPRVDYLNLKIRSGSFKTIYKVTERFLLINSKSTKSSVYKYLKRLQFVVLSLQ